MNISFPNQELIRYLIENYYCGVPIDQQYVSSHWQHYSQQINIQTDSKGNIVSLKGEAFGNCLFGEGSRRLIRQFYDWASILSHLTHLLHRRQLVGLMGKTANILKTMGLDPTFDNFRQVCSVALLNRHIPEAMQQKRLHVLAIGDGYGVFSGLFKALFPDSSLILIDIGRVMLFQAYYLQKAYPAGVHARVGEADLDQADFLYCPTEQIEALETCKFDIAVNIASMQEMNAATVSRYFTFLRKVLLPDNMFYCSNRESKTLLGGEVSKFFKYPWQSDDRYLVDEYCPWHQYFLSAGRPKNYLSLLGIRIPFVNFYDGKTWHRLAILSTS